MTPHVLKPIEALARAYDREGASQRGEPSPWDTADRGDGYFPIWRAERIACAEVGLRAYLSASQEAAAPSEEPVGYLFELCYSHAHDRWSGTMYSEHLPNPEDIRNVRPLFASPAVAPVAVSDDRFMIVSRRHFDALATALSEIKATNDGGSDQPIGVIVNWCIEEIDASPCVPKPSSDLNARILSSIIPATKGGEVEALRKLTERTENFWAFIQGEYGVRLSSANQDDHNVFEFFSALEDANTILKGENP